MMNKIVAAFLALLSSAAIAKVTLSPERLWELKRISDPSISPDGKTALFNVKYWRDTDEHFQSEIWSVDIENGQETLYLQGPFVSHARFSPDGKSIAYLSRSTKEEKLQIFLQSRSGSKAVQLTDVPDGISSFKWYPNSDKIMFSTNVKRGLSLDDYKTFKETKKGSKVTAQVYEKPFVRYWDRWLDDDVETHLFSVELKSRRLTPLTPGSGFSLPQFNMSVGSTYDVSPDGMSYIFAYDTQHDLGTSTDLIYYDGKSKAFVNITPENPANDSSPKFGPDGQIAFLQSRMLGFYADKRRIQIYDPKTKKTRQVAKSWDRSPSGLLWGAKAKDLWSTVEDQGRVKVFQIPLTDDVPKAFTEKYSYSSLVMNSDGSRMIALQQSLSFPNRLVSLDANGGALVPKLLSRQNKAQLENTELGKVESVTYKGSNGRDIQMWINYPPNFDPKKKWPVYLLMHGGPHGAINDQFHFRWNSQTFASWGYVVAWYNFHGSTGFGQEFAASIVKDWRTLPYRDTIKAAEFLGSKPWVDKKRMAAGGGSYGGYLATTLLGAEHPFTTLINHAGVFNSFTQVGADYGVGKNLRGPYWDDQYSFLEQSPHWHAAKFKTPTLIIHGQKDYRVPVSHALENYNVLKKLDVPTKLVYYPDENHWILKRHNSIHWYEIKEDWLRKHNKALDRS